MHFVSIVKSDPIRISLVPESYNDSFFPSVWTRFSLTLNLISYCVAKLFSDAVPEAINKIISINIFANEAEVSFSFFGIFPSVLDKLSSEEHVNSLEDIGWIGSYHINHSLIAEKISGFFLN